MLVTNIRAGIIGLYTAYELMEHGVSCKDIVVTAQFLPGDESITYASPYAGGCFSCITGNDPQTLFFDKYTYQNLGKLQAKLGGPSCGLDRALSTEYWEAKPAAEKIGLLRSYLEECSEIEPAAMAAGCEYGLKFKAWNFNCPRFLVALQRWLASQGVTFRREVFLHIAQAFGPSTQVVFNCTGLGARTLGGVRDHGVYATRGQVVVVKAEHVAENMFIWGGDSATYMIKRPYSHHQLVLGGFLQKDDWRSETLQQQTDDILRRTSGMYPDLLAKNARGPTVDDLEVVRVAAGLRPSRHGGVRIERDMVDEGRLLIHNYGASGYGYQAGLGMAAQAVALALEPAHASGQAKL